VKLNTARRGDVAWPAFDRQTAPATECDLIVPEPGRVIGAVFRLSYPDGRKETALAECLDGDWVAYHRPPPQEPPGPEFAAPLEAARRWMDGAGS